MRGFAIVAMTLMLAGGCHNPQAKKSTIEEMIGFDIEDYAKRSNLNLEDRVNRWKIRITNRPRDILFPSQGNLESDLGIMLQPPLTKVFIGSLNRDQVTDVEKTNNSNFQSVYEWFKQSASRTFMGIGVKVLENFDVNYPFFVIQSKPLRPSHISGDINNDPGGSYHYEILLELKRTLIDPVTGLKLIHTLWEKKYEHVSFDSVLTENDERELQFNLSLMLGDFINNEYKRGAFKVALRQLKEEDGLPETYKSILSNYKDW